LVLKEINAKIFGTGNEEYIKGLNLLAVVYNRIGQDEKTIPLLIESVAFHKKSFGDSSYEYGSALNRLAKVYEDIGNNEQALPVAEQAVSIIEISKGKQSLEYATGLTNLAIIKKTWANRKKQNQPYLLHWKFEKTGRRIQQRCCK
jgi:tetratricopeptide (TPR) repeat protein